MNSCERPPHAGTQPGGLLSPDATPASPAAAEATPGLIRRVSVAGASSLCASAVRRNRFDRQRRHHKAAVSVRTFEIQHRVPDVVVVTAPFIPILHQQGIKIIAVVASVKHAQKAEEAGADLLVAEGYEAAGINSNLELTTFTLIPQIKKSVSVPVVAAGGIGDGKGLAAAFMLGASGVQMGTRLIATKEAPFHALYKMNLLQASGTDTAIVGRSVGRVRRILNTSYAQKLLQSEKDGVSLEEFNELTSEDQHIKGALLGDMEKGFINSGQIVGLITSIPSVKELFESMIDEARIQINNFSQTLDESVSRY